MRSDPHRYAPTPAYPLHDAVPYGPAAYEPAPYEPAPNASGNRDAVPYQSAAHQAVPYGSAVRRLPRRPRGYDPLADSGRHHLRLAPAGW